MKKERDAQVKDSSNHIDVFIKLNLVTSCMI